MPGLGARGGTLSSPRLSGTNSNAKALGVAGVALVAGAAAGHLAGAKLSKSQLFRNSKSRNAARKTGGAVKGRQTLRDSHGRFAGSK